MFTSTTFIFLLVTLWTVSAEVGLGCKQGWTLYGEDCFYVGRGKITSDDADLECIGMEARLADSYGRLDGIKSLLEKTTSSGVKGAWVKNDVKNSEDCTILDAEKDWQVGVLPCDTDDLEMLYVCEGSPVIKDCFGSSCYTLSDERYSNPCNNGRGYLVRIESIEENQFVAEFLKNASSVADIFMPLDTFYFNYPIYIDGNDSAEEGLWVFSNGDKMTFFNWAEDEPNNKGGDENCIGILPRTYDWDDVWCDTRTNYLCEEDNIDMSE